MRKAKLTMVGVLLLGRHGTKGAFTLQAFPGGEAELPSPPTQYGSNHIVRDTRLLQSCQTNVNGTGSCLQVLLDQKISSLVHQVALFDRGLRPLLGPFPV